jgi:hypothetical protein
MAFLAMRSRQEYRTTQTLSLIKCETLPTINTKILVLDSNEFLPKSRRAHYFISSFRGVLPRYYTDILALNF